MVYESDKVDQFHYVTHGGSHSCLQIGNHSDQRVYCIQYSLFFYSRPVDTQVYSNMAFFFPSPLESNGWLLKELEGTV